VTSALVALFLTITLAPDSAAPFGSVTVPSKAPRMCWAIALAESAAISDNRPQNNNCLILVILID
jgi:hypothetical protein